MARILVVDDDAAVLRTASRILSGGGHAVDCAEDGIRALELLQRSSFDAVLSDISMPGLTGIEFLRAIRTKDLDIPVVLMTGDPSLDTAIHAIQFGAFRYLRKPVDPMELLAVINRAVVMHGIARLKREAIHLSGEPGKELGDRASLESRFAVALERLWMVYQPIVAWPAHQAVAYEALVRSDEPTLSSPLALLDAAERLGQVWRLSRVIRARVARDASDAPDGVLLFVNLHARDLGDEELYNPRSPLSAVADRVVLEITERASLDDVSSVEERVGHLRALGFRLAVDDLGAGYAGLTSLVQIDPEYLKLDMTLVRGIDTHPMKQHIVGSFTKLASEISKRLIAEGVETVEERATLERLGCTFLQGYLLGRPARGFAPPAG